VSERLIEVGRRIVNVIEQGEGAPLLYLHGFADVHGVSGSLFPFHEQLARHRRLIAPAHPGVNGSDELEGYSVDDVVYSYLGLIGATGLFIRGQLFADVFMHAQPERGVDYTTLRRTFFSSADAPLAQRYFPNGRGDIDEETRRYGMLRFGSFFGFKPPYFYNRSLIDRLGRADMPAFVAWGESDAMTPLSHGEAYARGLARSAPLMVVKGAGHAAHLESPEVTKAFEAFLAAQTVA
jgi:pimeloyl-ACP methyl ester carboxylesterase